MKIQLILVIALCCLYSQSNAGKLSRRSASALQAKRQVAAAPAETPAETLMRLKLLTYTEKLKAKEAKKQAKAQKKAAKDAAFASYMGSILTAQQAAAAAPPSPGVAGVVPAAPAAVAAPIPPMPMIPALGLWKKSFLLSQIAAAASASAAAAAAAAATTTPPPVPQALEATTTPSPVPEDDGEEADEDETINEIVKRYAPAIRKKMYGSGSPYDKYNKKNSDGDEDTDDDEGETLVPNYKTGAFNKFGSGPSGSPNGVGYDQGKINQAGCSGNHIHICSGTTVYLTSPEEDALQELELAVGELGEDDGEEEEETAPGVAQEEQGQKSNEESSNEKPKHGSKKQKHGHGRSH